MTDTVSHFSSIVNWAINYMQLGSYPVIWTEKLWIMFSNDEILLYRYLQTVFGDIVKKLFLNISTDIVQ